MNTARPRLDSAHVARIELVYSAHLRALHAGFGITAVVVDYDHDRDYVDLPGPPRDYHLRAPLEGGLVVEAYENVQGLGDGLFCPRGDEAGGWAVTVARWEAVDQSAPYARNCPPRIGVGLSTISWSQSDDRSPQALAQAIGTAIHSAADARPA